MPTSAVSKLSTEELLSLRKTNKITLYAEDFLYNFTQEPDIRSRHRIIFCAGYTEGEYWAAFRYSAYSLQSFLLVEEMPDLRLKPAKRRFLVQAQLYNVYRRRMRTMPNDVKSDYKAFDVCKYLRIASDVIVTDSFFRLR